MNKILKIVGYKNKSTPDYNKSSIEYKCIKDKEILLTNLMNFYSIEKFDTFFLEKKKTDENKDNFSMKLYDRSSIEYSHDYYKYILSVDCVYEHNGSSLRISLTDPYYDGYFMKTFNYAEFLDFSILLSDLSGL